MIRGNVLPSFDNRQTRQTKAASSPDKITVDFHAGTERIPKRVSIVTDSNQKDFLVQEKYKEQRRTTFGLKEKWKQCEPPKGCRVSRIVIGTGVMSYSECLGSKGHYDLENLK
jgi:hypothetical protein